MKIWHGNAVDIAYRTGCTDFNKVEFLASLTSIRQNALNPKTIRSAFRLTGIVPSNPHLILDKITKDLTATGGIRPPYEAAKPDKPRYWNDMSVWEKECWQMDRDPWCWPDYENARSGFAPWDRPEDESTTFGTTDNDDSEGDFEGTPPSRRSNNESVIPSSHSIVNTPREHSYSFADAHRL